MPFLRDPSNNSQPRFNLKCADNLPHKMIQLARKTMIRTSHPNVENPLNPKNDVTGEVIRLEDVLQSILAMQEMGEYLDVRLESFQNVVISSITGKITKAFTYRKTGVGVRILSGGAWGFCSTQDLSKESLTNTVKFARKMAQIESTKTKYPVQLAEIPIVEDRVEVECELDFREISLEDKVKQLLEWDHEIQTTPNIVRSLAEYSTISAMNCKGENVD